MSEKTELQGVIDSSPEGFKGWMAIVAFAVVGTSFGLSTRFENERTNEAVSDNAYQVEKNAEQISDNAEQIKILISNQLGIMNAQTSHEMYGEHRNSKPDIDRIDRVLLEWKIRDDLERESAKINEGD